MCALPIELFLGQFGRAIGAVDFAVVLALLALGVGVGRGHRRWRCVGGWGIVLRGLVLGNGLGDWNNLVELGWRGALKSMVIGLALRTLPLRTTPANEYSKFQIYGSGRQSVSPNTKLNPACVVQVWDSLANFIRMGESHVRVLREFSF